MYQLPLFPNEGKPPPLKIVPSQANTSLDRHSNYPYYPDALRTRSNNEQYPFLPSNILKSTDQRPLGNNIYPTHIRNKPYNQRTGKVSKPRRSEAEYEQLARSVYTDFLRCPPFANYRSRQPKTGNKKKAQVWPDEVEFAFFRAIVRYEPCGRVQEKPDRSPEENDDPKEMGRNERIADFITRVTGQLRKRKQVSSHIQVLRAYVGNNARLRKYLAIEQGSESKGAKQRAQNALNTTLPSQSFKQESLHTPASPDVTSATDVLDNGYSVSEIDMSLRITDPETGQLGHSIHTYTSTADERLSSQCSDEIFQTADQCLDAYPRLAHVNGHQPWSVPIIAIEASLAFPGPVRIPGDKELGICFNLQTPRVVSMLETHTTIFEGEEPRWSQEDRSSQELGRDGRSSYHLIRFCSKFWAEKLHALGSKLEQASMAATKAVLNDETQGSMTLRTRSIKQHVSNHLRQLHALQEIRMRAGPNESYLVLVIHWSFKQAPEASLGRTYWRKVQTPPVAGDPFVSPLEQFDAFEPSAEVLYETRRVHFEDMPGLLPPITLAGDGYPAPSLDDEHYFAGLHDSQASNAYGLDPSHDGPICDTGLPIHNFGQHVTSDSFGDYEHINFDLSRIPTDEVLQQYSQQWDFCNDHVDPQLPHHLPAIDEFTPSTATDSEHFSACGHVSTQEYHGQALAGAGPDVKNEEESQESIIFAHGCGQCATLPCCDCGPDSGSQSQEFKESQSSNGEVVRLTDVLDATLGEHTF